MFAHSNCASMWKKVIDVTNQTELLVKKLTISTKVALRF